MSVCERESMSAAVIPDRTKIRSNVGRVAHNTKQVMKRYYISWLYRARHEYNHDDEIGQGDAWQLEVYLHALGLMKKHKMTSVVDIGCGSAYKLLTYLKEYDTIGIEVAKTYEWLKAEYSQRKWLISDFHKTVNISADVAICADVIEHVTDPDELIEFIKGISFKYLILSTPDRHLLHRPWRRGFWGPPKNPTHQREWSFDEFERYVSMNFTVVDHRVTNLRQGTQMIICRP